MHRALKAYYQELEELATLRQIQALLGWDLQVTMPEEGLPARAKQQALVARQIHTRETNSRWRRLLDELEQAMPEFEPMHQRNIKESKRRALRASRLPQRFVARWQDATTAAYGAWVKAKSAHDFSIALPELRNVLSLARERCERLGYQRHPYEALFEDFEPHADYESVKASIVSLADGCGRLLQSLPTTTVQKLAPVEPSLQQQVCVALVEKLGLSFSHGRLDASAHPFQSTLGPRDIRITTRYSYEQPLQAIYSCIHELGHALYSLGRNPAYPGAPSADAASFALDESQSRFWDTILGRSTEFITFLARAVESISPGYAGLQREDQWLAALRHICPSHIRVDADEVTYPLHILLRLELEEALFNDGLAAEDLPALWNSLSLRYLGIEPADDAEGVLQDIHWYIGLFGYFPTYTLGTIYAAHFYRHLQEEVPALGRTVSVGDFESIQQWFQTQVHVLGATYSALEILCRSTNSEPSAERYLSLLQMRYAAN